MTTATEAKRCCSCLEVVTWLSLGAWGHVRSIEIRSTLPYHKWQTIAPSARSLAHQDPPCFMYDREGDLINSIYDAV